MRPLIDAIVFADGGNGLGYIFLGVLHGETVRFAAAERSHGNETFGDRPRMTHDIGFIRGAAVQIHQQGVFLLFIVIFRQIDHIGLQGIVDFRTESLTDETALDGDWINAPIYQAYHAREKDHGHS